ncbi:MAG: response regulator [Elainellaceae cyanobacterium]
MKILLVEDDEPTAAALASALTDDRHMVNIATDGQMGLMLAETYDYDLVLLDVLIPKLDGISICRKLRSQGMQMPILLLTAKDSQTDKIMGLDAGADDYVVKPFDLAELRARIRALLRRGSSPVSSTLDWENLKVDPAAGEVTYNHHLVPLTPKELSILELFLRNPHRVFSRSAIIDRIWSLADSPAESAVTTHIKDLRHKLRAGGMTIDLIETVYGLGYRLKSPPAPDPQAATPAPPAAQPSPAPATALASNAAPLASPAPKKGMAAVNQVLEKFRNSFVTQVNVLGQAQAALQTGQLDQGLREHARQEAHKLAGSLGIFGYPNGSRLAREAEYLLIDTAIPVSVAIDQLSQIVGDLRQELAKSPVDSSGLKERQEVRQLRTNPESPASSYAANLDHLHQPLVLVIDDDVALTDQLQIAAAAQGIHTEVASNPETARQTIAHTLPDVVLLDLAFSNSTEDGLTFLAELTRQHPSLPVVVVTGRNSLGDRVEVSRLGGKAFLQKPVSVQQILQTITQVFPQSQSTEAKVLIVDDDLATLAALSSLLHPWGLQVKTLNDPQHFWEELVATEPDLVVVDLEMPTFSGIDLCQVMRHDPRWGNLPILVVTAHTDANSIRSVFAAGADDFIAKPVVGPELVTRILSRIERMRSLNSREQQGSRA